jgi:uncharacterized protein
MMFIGIITFLASLLASTMLKRRFAEYSKIGLSNGLTGRQIAEKMLRDNGIFDVKIIQVEGQLTDHYNPQNKTVNLSYEVYASNSVAAAAVAAHEVGHAVQHATAYSMLGFRSAMVPILSITSNYMQWIIMIGAMLLTYSPIPLGIGVALFALTTLFSVITLPVEFDASARAIRWMEERQMANDRERGYAKSALRWAASTYVVAALGSIANLIYLLRMLGGSRSDD